MVARRVAIVTPEAVDAKMAGPAIRAWHMAEVLSADHDVRLLSTVSADRNSDGFDVAVLDNDGARHARAWADVVVTHPGVLRTHSELATRHKQLVVDIYDPFHLENLAAGGASNEERRSNVVHLNGVLNDALRRGDSFLCASEPQRDFWVGGLASLGRVNPSTYDRDPTLRNLIDVAPFGIDPNPPQPTQPALRGVVPGIGPSDRILLWGGGVYNWFDPVTLIEAIDIVRRTMDDVRLVFLGMRHPNPHVPPMRAATEARERAAALGITGRHVFFNENWIPYDERGSYLLEADLGVSTHQRHVETAYAFRTRILDYLWAGLPIVTSAGDVFASLIEAERLGAVVPPGDPSVLAEAIIDLLGDEVRRATCALNARRVARTFAWPDVLRPLVSYCASGSLAADHPGSPMPATPTAEAAHEPPPSPRRSLRRWLRR